MTSLSGLRPQHCAVGCAPSTASWWLHAALTRAQARPNGNECGLVVASKQLSRSAACRTLTWRRQPSAGHVPAAWCAAAARADGAFATVASQHPNAWPPRTRRPCRQAGRGKSGPGISAGQHTDSPYCQSGAGTAWLLSASRRSLHGPAWAIGGDAALHFN